MSACISRQGEYSDHVPGSGADRFLCQRCYVFDEDDALAALKVAEEDSARLREQLEAARALAADPCLGMGCTANCLEHIDAPDVLAILGEEGPGHAQ